MPFGTVSTRVVTTSGAPSFAPAIPRADDTSAMRAPRIPVVRGQARPLALGGRIRTYRMYRPAAFAGPAPLVVVLHGGFGSGAQAQQAYGWDLLADKEGFAVAYP